MYSALVKRLGFSAAALIRPSAGQRQQAVVGARLFKCSGRLRAESCPGCAQRAQRGLHHSQKPAHARYAVLIHALRRQTSIIPHDRGCETLVHYLMVRARCTLPQRAVTAQSTATAHVCFMACAIWTERCWCLCCEHCLTCRSLPVSG